MLTWCMYFLLDLLLLNNWSLSICLIVVLQYVYSTNAGDVIKTRLCTQCQAHALQCCMGKTVV